MSESFHFLNPLWLVALVPLGVLLFVLFQRRRRDNQWESLIAPELLPVLMEGKAQGKGNLPYGLVAIGMVLAVIALANPVWEKLPQPVFETSNARVIVLDLSLSMYSPDIAPHRLTRSKFKIRDLLHQPFEGQTGLVVFAGDAFVVSPLTRDVDTIESLLDALDPSIMPVQGSRLDLGLDKALDALQKAGLSKGRIIAITDGFDSSRTEEVAALAYESGFPVSILAVGTPEGAPLPNGRGGVIKDREGQVVLPKLDEDGLHALADNSGGVFALLTADGRDLDFLDQGGLLRAEETERAEDLFADRWKESGPWIVLLLLPLAAMAFRKGWLLSLLIVLTASNPPTAAAFELESLWSNNEQRSQSALGEGDYDKTLDLSKDSLRRGSALYRKGDFEGASAEFSQQDTASAHFNRGNSLFNQSQFDDAIAAYDRALELQPDMQDALENRAMAQQMKQQPPQQNEDSSSDSNKENQKQEDPQESDSDQEQSQSHDGDNSDSDENQDAGESESQQEEQENSSDRSDKESQSQDSTQDDQQQPEEQKSQSGEPESEQQDANSEEQLAAEQWLRRIPDDPGELLRRKFLLQYQQREQRAGTGSPQPW